MQPITVAGEVAMETYAWQQPYSLQGIASYTGLQREGLGTRLCRGYLAVLDSMQ